MENYAFLTELLAEKEVSCHPKLKNWTKLKGRLSCFETILPFLESVCGSDATKIKRKINYLNCFKQLLIENLEFLVNKNGLNNLENRYNEEKFKLNFLKENKKFEKIESDQYLRLINSKATLQMEKIDSNFKEKKEEKPENLGTKYTKKGSLEASSINSGYLKRTLNLEKKRRQEMLERYNEEYMVKIEEDKSFSIKCLNNENLRKIELSESYVTRVNSQRFDDILSSRNIFGNFFLLIFINKLKINIHVLRKLMMILLAKITNQLFSNLRNPLQLHLLFQIVIFQ